MRGAAQGEPGRTVRRASGQMTMQPRASSPSAAPITAAEVGPVSRFRSRSAAAADGRPLPVAAAGDRGRSRPGLPALIYIVGYAMVRFALELVRGDAARPQHHGISELSGRRLRRSSRVRSGSRGGRRSARQPRSRSASRCSPRGGAGASCSRRLAELMWPRYELVESRIPGVTHVVVDPRPSG
jgi:hypothetical protein